MAIAKISVRGARQHNLKNIDVEFPRNTLTVITGLSGSGKSSLAFDTIYAEGQRRYVETLSAYARQFLDQMERPDVDSIDGLSPSISIEQKTTSRSPRSTVGTITEIYDYLRLLYSSIGLPHCPSCGKPITRQSVEQISARVMELAEGAEAGAEPRVMLLAPIVRGRKGEFTKELEKLAAHGFTRARIDGELVNLEDDIRLDKRRNHTIEVVVDRLLLKPGIERRLANSVEVAMKLGQGLVQVAVVGGQGEERLYSSRMACPACGINVPQMEPRSFSFNSVYGACPECHGLGSKYDFDPAKVVVDWSKPLLDGGLGPGSGSTYLHSMVKRAAEHHGFDLSVPFEQLPPAAQNLLLYGTFTPANARAAFAGDPALTPANAKTAFAGDPALTPANAKTAFAGDPGDASSGRADEKAVSFGGAPGSGFRGVFTFLRQMMEESNSDSYREWLLSYMSATPCPRCQGRRLRPESLAVTVNGMSIADFTGLPVTRAMEAVGAIRLNEREEKIAGRVLREIGERLGFLHHVGLGYISLDRSAATLSGGEGQRIRLATQIGSRLRGVLYVLDEPSIGLHHRDNSRLLQSLESLRDLGNTVLVVEHDEETIRRADYVIDLGPGAGRHGGAVVAAGTPGQIADEPASLTGQYISGRKQIPVRQQRRQPNGQAITILGAQQNNLKNLDVSFPLGVMTVVTGVSGSGKSTLVNDILYRALARQLYRSREDPGKHRAIQGSEQIDKVIRIDQSPIGRTPRSNPATYTGVFTNIRELYAMLPESRERGYKAGRFSFNVSGGRCEACQGEGQRRIEMNFLPDVYVLCELCGGQRYNHETLTVKYKGCSIADLLDTPIADALTVLENIPQARQKLQTLVDVGLGYIHLGQSSVTLSGGEAQRIKLGRELSKRQTGRTLYLLDEPTTGLHFEDVNKLLDVLHRLTDLGNTVIIIEHHLDVIRNADWIIDLGPEGGEEGGRLVAQGMPEQVARIRKSYTGQALAGVLKTGE
jgi:excinuclease ABC subunit A